MYTLLATDKATATGTFKYYSKCSNQIDSAPVVVDIRQRLPQKCCTAQQLHYNRMTPMLMEYFGCYSRTFTTAQDGQIIIAADVNYLSATGFVGQILMCILLEMDKQLYTGTDYFTVNAQ
jgi:hypothetical protein